MNAPVGQCTSARDAQGDPVRDGQGDTGRAAATGHLRLSPPTPDQIK
jgi:hypothetical protein